MKNLLLFFLIGILLFLYGCGGGSNSIPVPTQVPERTISGVALDSAGDLLAGETVTLRTDKGNTVTTSNGAFSLTVTSNRNFIISSGAPGHKGALTGGNITGDLSNLQIILSDENDGQRPSVKYIKN